MNTFGTRVISQRATGAARWATAASVPAGHGVHFGGGGILLALLVLVVVWAVATFKLGAQDFLVKKEGFQLELVFSLNNALKHAATASTVSHAATE